MGKTREAVALARILALVRPDAWQALWAGGEPALLFKHSTTCSVSALAHRTFTAWATALREDAPALAVVRVREERALSRRIAQDTGVPHASPQVLALRAGRSVGRLEAGAITAERLDALRAAAAGVDARP
jgi:bacillithiol system protein YtxJ